MLSINVCVGAPTTLNPIISITTSAFNAGIRQSYIYVKKLMSIAPALAEPEQTTHP